MKVKNKTERIELDEDMIPVKLTPKQRAKADAEISAFVKSRKAEMTDDMRYRAKLLQLKFQIEDYVNSGEEDNTVTFGYFLNEYIHFLNIAKREFSKEINLHSTKLSRILSGTEEPNEKLFVRLEIHSGNAIPAIAWYKIAEKQRQFRFLHNRKLRASESKLVTARIKAL